MDHDRAAIRYGDLERSRDAYRADFAKAEPFPHLVLDDLFDPDGLRRAAAEFPSPDEMPEHPSKRGVLELSDRALVPPRLRHVSDQLLAPRFVDWLSWVSGVEGLVTDRDGSWGVLRQSGDGVEGSIHVPPSRHPSKPLYRRLTLILHLSEDLSESNGGCFQLWDADKDAPRASYAPLFNRAVVFLTGPEAFHNASRTHLAPGQMRRVIQALYFTAQ